MLEIFGWLVLVIIGLQLSVVWLILGVVGSMGKWTIGGAYNSISVRITATIAGFLVVLYWYWIYTISPFTVIVN
jgi:hypothetical protein